MFRGSVVRTPPLPLVSWSLCLWARHFTHLASCECVWLLYVWDGGWRGCRCWMAATLPSVCPRAAVAIVVYHHWYDCVWMEPGTLSGALDVLKSAIQIQAIIIPITAVLQNYIGAVMQWTHIWWNLRVSFLPDKPSSVSVSNPNSEYESESEDTSVAKKGRKCCFQEEWVRRLDWLRFLREMNSMSCKFCSLYPQHVGNTKFEVCTPAGTSTWSDWYMVDWFFFI